MIYASYDVFLHKDLSFGRRDNCTWVEIFSGVNFFKIAIKSLTCQHINLTALQINEIFYFSICNTKLIS